MNILANSVTINLLLIPFQQEIGRAYHASCLFFGKKSCPTRVYSAES